VHATTGETGDDSPNFADARKIEIAVRAFVKKTPRSLNCWEREIVRALFVADSKIDTRRSPLLAVGCNSAALRPKLGEQVCELVQKCALDLVRMLVQTRIERDQFVSEVSATGAAFQARVPFHTNGFVESEIAQQRVGRQFKVEILP
jgi:hypothetical protein